MDMSIDDKDGRDGAYGSSIVFIRLLEVCLVFLFLFLVRFPCLLDLWYVERERGREKDFDSCIYVYGEQTDRYLLILINSIHQLDY